MAKEKTTKVKKKKLIRVRVSPALLKQNPYKPTLSGGSLYFSLTGPQTLEADGLRVRHQVSSFVTCREELCEMPRNYLNTASGGYVARDNKDYVDMEKFRLLIAGTPGDAEAAKRGVFSAKRVLNILEEEAGWDKSTITSVVYEPVTSAKAWLLTAPKQWTISPQMISLCSLIMRMGYKSYGFSAGNLKEVLSEFAKLAGQNGDNDHRYIKCCHKHIVPLMANIDKIFCGDLKQYFPKSGEAWRGRGGVYTFFTDRSGNDALDKRLKKYCK